MLLAVAIAWGWPSLNKRAYAEARPEACEACHGAQLRGDESFAAPNLSVLPIWYIERQLRNYRMGLRAPTANSKAVGSEPRCIAPGLDEAQIKAVTQLIADLPRRSAAGTIPGDIARGSELYRTCAACHGQRAEGIQMLNAPPLAGQNDWYLLNQLRSYKQGTRGMSGDISGIQMRASTGVLADEAAMKDVVAYVSSLSN